MNIMQPFYEKNLISTYDEKNVLYIGHIGKHDGETLFKLGKTKNIYTRDYEQHRKTFDTFNVIHIIECDNKDVVEQKFKNELKVKNLMRDFTTAKGKVQAEVFAESNIFSINDVINILNELVELYPLDALAEKKVNFKIKKNQNAVEVLIEKEKTRQLELKLENNKIELENNKIELESKKLEFEIIKLKTKNKNKNKNEENEENEENEKNKDKQEKKIDIYKQYLDARTEKSNKHIHTCTLYDDFKDWCDKNNPTSIPSNSREFVKEVKKHHDIEHVRVDGKLSTGFKNLKIIVN
jgi:hypothetical protein